MEDSRKFLVWEFVLHRIQTPYIALIKIVSTCSLTEFVGQLCSLLPSWKSPISSSTSLEHQDISWYHMAPCICSSQLDVVQPKPLCRRMNSDPSFFWNSFWLVWCSYNIPSPPTQTLCLPDGFVCMHSFSIRLIIVNGC